SEQLPAGFELIAAEPAVGKPAASRVRGVSYLIEVADDLDWDQAVERYLAADAAVVTRTAPKKADKRIDVRAFCTRISHGPDGLVADIDLTEAGTARPEEVATAVAATIGDPNHHPDRAHGHRAARSAGRSTYVTVIANTTKTILISVDLSELRVAVLEE